MHYIAPCFAFNLAQIGALLCGFAAYHAKKDDSAGMGRIAYVSGTVAFGFAVAACVMAWNL
jgi:predicted membrane protein